MPGIRRLKVNHVGEILLKCCTGQYMVFMYVPGHDNRHVVAIRDGYVFDSTGPKTCSSICDVNWSLADLRQIYYLESADMVKIKLFAC